jgi:small subunit ribosomal protein S16
MLTIRFKRVGRKHQPSFRVVIAEKRSKRDGLSIDDIGFYNPITKEFSVKKERLEHWINVGAKPTPTVHNLLVNHKLISGPKIKIKTKKGESKQENQEVQNESQNQEQTQNNQNEVPESNTAESSAEELTNQ